MSDRPEKRMVEFIESYWTGGEYGSDYCWNDNHGELVRCKDCKWWEKGLCKSDDVSRKIYDCGCYPDFRTDSYWFCADGERKEKDNGDE